MNGTAETIRTHSPERLARKFIAHFDALHRKTKSSVRLAVQHGLCFQHRKTNEVISRQKFLDKIFSEKADPENWELVKPRQEHYGKISPSPG